MTKPNLTEEMPPVKDRRLYSSFLDVRSAVAGENTRMIAPDNQYLDPDNWKAGGARLEDRWSYYAALIDRGMAVLVLLDQIEPRRYQDETIITAMRITHEFVKDYADGEPDAKDEVVDHYLPWLPCGDGEDGWTVRRAHLRFNLDDSPKLADMYFETYSDSPKPDRYLGLTINQSDIEWHDDRAANDVYHYGLPYCQIHMARQTLRLLIVRTVKLLNDISYDPFEPLCPPVYSEEQETIPPVNDGGGEVEPLEWLALSVADCSDQALDITAELSAEIA